MDKKSIDAAKQLLQYIKDNPKAVESIKEPSTKPVDVAKQLIKVLQENPAQLEELVKMAPKPVSSTESETKPLDLATQLLKALQADPKAFEELSKAGKQLEGDEQEVKDSEDPAKIQKELDKIKEGDKSLVRDSQVQDVTFKVTGDGKDNGPGKHSGPKSQDEVTNKLVEKDKDAKGFTKKGELSAGKKMSSMEQKQMIKDELKAEWKPRFAKKAELDKGQLVAGPATWGGQRKPGTVISDTDKPETLKGKGSNSPAKKASAKKAELCSPERKKMIKDELKSDFKPRFQQKKTLKIKSLGNDSVGFHSPQDKKTFVNSALKDMAKLPGMKPKTQKDEAGPTSGMTPGDSAPSAMKAQKDPSFKPVPATKIVKPSDVVSSGAAAMGVPKAKLGLATKPKIN